VLALVVDRLELTKARSDRWLADNIDNPFCDWDADSPAFGKAAMKLWKSALQEARKLDASRSHPPEATASSDSAGTGGGVPSPPGRDRHHPRLR